MIKKIASLMMQGLILALSTANIAMAQGGAPFPPEALNAFAQEPPISQADVDLYMKALPKLSAAMDTPTPEARDQVLRQLPAELGVTEYRFFFITTRIGLAYALAQGDVTPEQLAQAQLPAIVLPTEADKALVANNMSELTRVTNEAQQGTAQ